MGLLDKFETFINEKTQMLENAINGAASNIGQMDFNEMINKAENTINGLMTEATTQCKSALNDLNTRVNGTPQNMSNMQPQTQVQSEQVVNQSSIIGGESFTETKPAISNDTEPEVKVSPALSLEKETVESTPVTLVKSDGTSKVEIEAGVNLDKTATDEQTKVGINLKK